MQIDPEKPGEKPSPPRNRTVITEPDFNRPVKPIAELLTAPEFPKCALGEFVDIGGYSGVVVEIVNQSLKVRSPEGATKSFNVNGLRRIYGPVVHPDPIPEIPPPPTRTAPAPSPSPALSESRTPWVENLNRPAPAPPPPPVEPTIEPDFSKPVKKIGEFVKRSDYPHCVLGEHIEVAGYSGVVVQIVHRSLKVRAQNEVTRSYNADALRRLYA